MSTDGKDKDTRSMEVLAEIRAPADVVWRALTDGRELSNGFAPAARVDKPGVGGTVTLSWGEGITWQTKIHIAQPGKHLRWLDDPPGSGDPIGRAARGRYPADDTRRDDDRAARALRLRQGRGLERAVRRHEGGLGFLPVQPATLC